MIMWTAVVRLPRIVPKPVLSHGYLRAGSQISCIWDTG